MFRCGEKQCSENTCLGMITKVPKSGGGVVPTPLRIFTLVIFQCAIRASSLESSAWFLQ